MLLEKISDWFKSKMPLDYDRVSQSIKNVYTDTKKLVKSLGDYVDELFYASPGIVGVYGTLKNYSTSSIHGDYNTLKQDYDILKDSLKHKFAKSNSKNNVKNNVKTITIDDVLSNNEFKTDKIYTSNKTGNPQDKYYDNHDNYNTYLKNIGSKKISEIIHHKNKRYNGIDELVGEYSKKYDVDAKTFIRDVAKAKASGRYLDTPKIYYDKNFAPEGMNKEMLKLYEYSDASLRKISGYLEKKYGMHVSTSTISKHSRKYLSKRHGHDIENRKMAKSINKKKK
jgi:hypothetical protein